MNQKTQQKLLNIVRQNYNQIAKEFNKTRLNCFWPELINLTKKVKDGDNILDVGCGNGRLLELFKDKKINYLGVDSSEELINLSRQKYLSKYNQFKIGDILELDKIKEINFDHVFCIAVFHHLPGQDLQIKALKQLKNKLNPGGAIVLTAWNLWSQAKYRKLIFKFALQKLIGLNEMNFGDILFDWKNNKGENLSQRYYHAFTKMDLKKIAQKAGLKIKKIYKDKSNYYLVLT